MMTKLRYDHYMGGKQQGVIKMKSGQVVQLERYSTRTFLVWHFGVLLAALALMGIVLLTGCATGREGLPINHTPLLPYGNVPRICKPPLFVMVKGPDGDTALPTVLERITKSATEYWVLRARSTVFLYGGTTGESYVWDGFVDGFVTIEWGPLGGVKKTDENDPKAAVSTLNVDIITGCISGAIVRVDSEYMNDPDRGETVLRHELGHVLGLDHSRFEEDLMYGHLRSGTVHPIDASEEEINTVRWIYRKDGHHE